MYFVIIYDRILNRVPYPVPHYSTSSYSVCSPNAGTHSRFFSIIHCPRQTINLLFTNKKRNRMCNPFCWRCTIEGLHAHCRATLLACLVCLFFCCVVHNALFLFGRVEKVAAHTHGASTLSFIPVSVCWIVGWRHPIYRLERIE